MGEFLIRRANSSEGALLADLGRAAFLQTFAADNTPEDMQEYLESSFSPEIQTAELSMPGSTYFVMQTDTGVPIGFTRLLSGLPDPCVTGKSPIELVRFYLLQEWIGKGNGGKLMQACIDFARGGGYDVMWLGVWQQNPRAIKFYEKWGFRIVGEHTFRLGSDAQTDWIMQRQLE